MKSRDSFKSFPGTPQQKKVIEKQQKLTLKLFFDCPGFFCRKIGTTETSRSGFVPFPKPTLVGKQNLLRCIRTTFFFLPSQLRKVFNQFEREQSLICKKKSGRFFFALLFRQNSSGYVLLFFSSVRSPASQ